MLPTSVTIGATDICLCWTNIDIFSPAELSTFELLLSRTELAYVCAAKTDMLRKQRLVSRGILREKLSAITGCAAASVPLEISPQGKPYLAGSPGTAVKFSVAYSRCWVLHAFSDGIDIGVDIEHINPEHMTTELISYVIDAQQRLAFDALPEARRVDAFFAQWVNKEAVLKAAGCGLQGLSDCKMESSDGAWCQGQTVWCQNQWWQLVNLASPPGYVAAVASTSVSHCDKP